MDTVEIYNMLKIPTHNHIGSSYRCRSHMCGVRAVCFTQNSRLNICPRQIIHFLVNINQINIFIRQFFINPSNNLRCSAQLGKGDLRNKN